MRPNKIFTINGATASTVPAWENMQNDTTAKTGWIDYVHQHEKMPSEKHNSKWRSSNANSTISNSTHRDASTILAPNFYPAHHESYTEPHENASIVQEKNKDQQQNPKLLFEWVNNKNDPRTNGLHPTGCKDGGQNMKDAAEFEFAQNAHETTSKEELAQYYHQSLFSPPVVTTEKAIDNDQLKSFLGLEKALPKHLLRSSATIKGHMRKQRKGFRSTRANQNEILESR